MLRDEFIKLVRGYWPNAKTSDDELAVLHASLRGVETDTLKGALVRIKHTHPGAPIRDVWGALQDEFFPKTEPRRHEGGTSAAHDFECLLNRVRDLYTRPLSDNEAWLAWLDSLCQPILYSFGKLRDDPDGKWAEKAAFARRVEGEHWAGRLREEGARVPDFLEA